MFPNTSNQSLDLFKDCLGFARQMSQSPGLYCRLEVKLEKKSLNFQTGSPKKFPGKRKSPSDYRKDQRRRNPLERGWLLLVQSRTLSFIWSHPHPFFCLACSAPPSNQIERLKKKHDSSNLAVRWHWVWQGGIIWQFMCRVI